MANLIVRIGGDATGFAAAAQSVEGRAKKLNATLAGAVGRSFAAGALAMAGKSTIDFASNMVDLATAAGTTAERMQEINYAAMQNGTSIDAMAVAMRNLAKAREEAMQKPGGEKAQAFAAIGIQRGELAGLRDSGDLLYRVGDAVRTLNIDANSTPQLLQLIGNRNQQVLPAMKAGLREAGEEARRLNLILGEGMASSLEKLGDQISKVGLFLKVNLGGPVIFVARALTTITTAILQIPAAASLAMNSFNLMIISMAESAAKAINKLNGSGFQGTFSSPEAISTLTAARQRAEFEIATAKAELQRLSDQHANLYDDNVPGAKKGFSFDDAMEEAKADEAERQALRAESDEAERLAAIYRDIVEINRRAAREKMTEKEVTADITKELQEQQALRELMAQEAATAIELAEQDKRIAQLKAELAGREKRPGVARGERGFFPGLSTDAIGKIGGTIGGAGPRVVADLLGRQHLAEAKATARNTGQMVRQLSALAAKGWGER